MIKSFKEFLKKNADVIFTEGIPSEDTYISTKELGEWAINNFILGYGKFWERSCKKVGFKETLEGYIDNPYIEIAVACLGKKEIERHLKEVKERGEKMKNTKKKIIIEGTLNATPKCFGELMRDWKIKKSNFNVRANSYQGKHIRLTLELVMPQKKERVNKK